MFSFDKKTLTFKVGDVAEAVAFAIKVRAVPEGRECFSSTSLPVQKNASGEHVAIHEFDLFDLNPTNDVRVGEFEAEISPLNAENVAGPSVTCKFELNAEQVARIREELAKRAPAKPATTVIPPTIQTKDPTGFRVIDKGRYAGLAIMCASLSVKMYRFRITRLLNEGKTSEMVIEEDLQDCTFVFEELLRDKRLENGGEYKLSVAGYHSDGNKATLGPWGTFMFHVAGGKLVAGPKPAIKPQPTPAVPPTPVASKTAPAPTPQVQTQPASTQSAKEVEELRKKVAELEKQNRQLVATSAQQTEEQVKIVKDQAEVQLRMVQNERDAEHEERERLEAEARRRATTPLVVDTPSTTTSVPNQTATGQAPQQTGNQPQTGQTPAGTQQTPTAPTQPVTTNWWRRYAWKIAMAIMALLLALVAVVLVIWATGTARKDPEMFAKTDKTPVSPETPVTPTSSEIDELKRKLEKNSEEFERFKALVATTDTKSTSKATSAETKPLGSGNRQSGNTVTAHTIIGVVNNGNIKNSTIKIHSSEVWTSEWKPTLPTVTCGMELREGEETFTLAPRDIQCIIVPEGWLIRCTDGLQFIDMMCGGDTIARTYQAGNASQPPMKIDGHNQFRFRLKSHITEETTIRFEVRAPRS